MAFAPSNLWLIGALPLLALLTLSSNQAETATCRPPAPSDSLIESYPAHQLSPQESLHSFDSVFYGEVVVPSRPCSLGYCAGLRIVSRIKGQTPPTVLIQSMRPGDGACGPGNFNDKGVRWVVFANHGTTRGGTSYLYADDSGPSYVSTIIPDFDRLELSYRELRARLDEAIDSRLGRRPRLR